MADRATHPTPEDFQAALEAHPKLLLYFWGPDCPNCEIFKRSWPKLLPELDDLPVDFVALDAYQYPEVARRYAVYGIPHFLLFKGGRKIGKMSEFRGERFWSTVVREQL